MNEQKGGELLRPGSLSGIPGGLAPQLELYNQGFCLYAVGWGGSGGATSTSTAFWGQPWCRLVPLSVSWFSLSFKSYQVLNLIIIIIFTGMYFIDPQS